MKKRLVQSLALLSIVAMLIVGLPVPAAYAFTTWHVTKLADTNDGVCSISDCSLREAISVASSGDAITFSVTGTITLALGQLNISQSVAIVGPGSGLLSIDANLASRIFNIAGGATVSISGLTLKNGRTNGENGGAVLNAGDLSMSSMVLLDNTATISSCGGTCLIYGGGIYSSGPLSVSLTTFQGNDARSAGGGIYYDNVGGELNLSNVTFFQNEAIEDHSLGSGGGLYINAASSATVDSTGFQSNTSYGDGGGLFTGTSITVTNSVFLSNGSNLGSGGGLEASAGVATLSGSYFSGNQAFQSGGAIALLGGNLSVSGSTLVGNAASYGNGGGLHVNSSGSTTIADSTLSGNTAPSGGGMSVLAGSSVLIYNSTLYGNWASANGGGVYGNNAPLSLINATIAGNGAASGGGGLYQDSAGALHLSNTILANSSSGGDCTSLVALTTDVHNLIEANDVTHPCGSPTLTADPSLAGLANNGGLTQTMALIAGSPAIDAGDSSTCADASTVTKVDQRGRPRNTDGNHDGTSVCDIGAYEAATFADVPVLGKEWMEVWVNAFYNAGITTGCGLGPLIYCPESNVTREEMAVFILRAIHGKGYVPPAASGYFADMPVAGKEWMEPWVDEFYREGLTTGCGISPLI